MLKKHQRETITFLVISLKLPRMEVGKKDGYNICIRKKFKGENFLVLNCIEM